MAIATNTYVIQEGATPAGTLKVTLNSGVAGLTVPSYPSIIIDDDFAHKIDEHNPSLQEIAHVRCRFREDYSNHAAGFWNTVLANAEVQIRFQLDEGSGYTELFWGQIDSLSGRLQEHYLPPGGTAQREGEFMLVSLLYNLKSLTIADLITEMDVHDISANTTTLSMPASSTVAYIIKVTEIIASALKSLNGTYALTDVAVQANQDLQLFTDFVSGNGWASLSDFYVPIGYDDGAQQWWGYTDSTDDNYWGNLYASAFEVINALARSFLFVPRYYYDASAGRHKIELMSRGYSYTVGTEQYAPVNSMFMPKTDTTIRTMAVESRVRTDGTDKLRWYFKRGRDPYTGVIKAGEFPDLDGAEVQFTLDHEMNNNYTTPSFNDYITPVWYISGETEQTGGYVNIRVKDAYAGAYAGVSYMSEAVVYYYFFRYAGFKSYERDYPTLKLGKSGTFTHTNLEIMRAATIDSVDYYATEVRKNISTGRSFVRWEQVGN